MKSFQVSQSSVDFSLVLQAAVGVGHLVALLVDSRPTFPQAFGQDGIVRIDGIFSYNLGTYDRLFFVVTY